MTLDELEIKCKNCTKCDLCEGRTNLVFGIGKKDADIMLIGEGPGENEDLQGQPFVGRSGQLLDKFLASVDLSRDKNVYIANMVKCRPPKNRDPKPEEQDMCINWLRKQFKIIKDNFNFGASVKKAAEEVYNVTDMTLRGVGQMLTGERSGEDVGGIIRIAEMSGDISRTRGILDFLYFMALLSINLGLINLFPIPVLDGGHVVIYLLEIVSRRELNTKFRDYLFKIGLGFILFLMVFATWNDIKHLITRWFE